MRTINWRIVVLAALFTMSLLLSACTPKREVPQAPLKTQGTTDAPPACQELRKRGGSC